MPGSIDACADSGLLSGPGAGSSCSRTDWGLIDRAARGGGGSALELVARRYWPAVYAYCRSAGLRPHDAADMTQGFICDVVLERGLLRHADPHRGRFRTLLLTALRNFMRDHQRHRSRRRRTPEHGPPHPLHDEDDVAAEAASSPEHAFTTQWARTMVHAVLDDVRRECMTAGLEPHWRLFEQRVARPMLLGEPPACYEHLVSELALDHVGQAANMIVTVKRRVARALRTEVRRTVADDDDVQAELYTLLGELGTAP